MAGARVTAAIIACLAAPVSARAVAGGSAVGFAAGWNIADVGSVADELADAYGVGLAVVGLFTTVLFLAHMLMQLPSGQAERPASVPPGVRRRARRARALQRVAAIAAEPCARARRPSRDGCRHGARLHRRQRLRPRDGRIAVRAGALRGSGHSRRRRRAGGRTALLDPLGWRAPYLSAIAVAGAAAAAAGGRPACPGRARAGGERPRSVRSPGTVGCCGSRSSSPPRSGSASWSATGW